MFKNRSPFMVPQIPGSSGRKKTISVVDQKRQMSIQPPSNSEKKAQIPLHMKQKNVTVALTTNQQKFCFKLAQPDQNDQTLYWDYQLNNQVSNQYARKLIFRQQQFCIMGATQDGIVDNIYIVADNVLGYKSQNGIFTNRVCALHLSHMQSLIDDADIRSYDLIYRQTQDVAWDIPMDLSNVRFRIQADGQFLSGPLHIPLTCQFDIRHVGR